jgi:ribosomal RNA assembly protein
MKKIICEKLPRIIKNKKKLQETLNVKITNRGKEVYLEGTSENEYVAEKVIDALNFGFSLDKALLIKKEELMFEIIHIKDHTKRNDLERIRGRIIGKGGKTLKTLSDLSECFIETNENHVGIIGYPEFIELAQEALISIIKGSKQSNVYAHLEKIRPAPIEDLGLKEEN